MTTPEQKIPHSYRQSLAALFPVWRTVIVGSIIVIAFNLFWLLPALNDVEARVLSHLLEIAEKIEIEASEFIIHYPKNQADEFELFVSQRLHDEVTIDTIDQREFFQFLENREDIVELYIIDSTGKEKARVSRAKVFADHELRAIGGSDYFIEAMSTGFSARALHVQGKPIPNIAVFERVRLATGEIYVFGADVDISERVKGFSRELQEDENEYAYIADDTGVIIDHYNHAQIGSSLLQVDFARSIYAEKESGEKYTYQFGTYNDAGGQKLQAVALQFDPVNFVIVVEEPYAEVWRTWNRFLIFALIGLSLFFLLVLFLTRSTTRAIFYSRQVLQEKEKTESIITNLETGIIEYSPGFEITLINPRAEEMLGVRKGEVEGKVIRPDTLTEKPAMLSLVQVLYPILSDSVKKIHVKKGLPDIVEMKIMRPAELDVQVTTIPIRDEHNIVIRYLKVVRDVSREQAIAKSKSEFISVAAHQLRTPLSAIKWVLKLMLDQDAGPISEEQRDLLKKGYDSNERMIELVTDMLDIARIEEGKFGFEFHHVNLIPLIDKAIEAFSMKAKEKNITLIFEKPEKDFSLKMDSARIELVLQNLVDNALKYTQNNGTITITVEQIGMYVRVGVRDSGIGVPKEQMGKLFTRFFRGANAVKLQTEGSGLGLFLVRNIIARHGGSVAVETEENKGSTFSFTLPLDEGRVHENNGEQEEFIEGLSS